MHRESRLEWNPVAGGVTEAHHQRWANGYPLQFLEPPYPGVPQRRDPLARCSWGHLHSRAIHLLWPYGYPGCKLKECYRDFESGEEMYDTRTYSYDPRNNFGR